MISENFDIDFIEDQDTDKFDCINYIYDEEVYTLKSNKYF